MTRIGRVEEGSGAALRDGALLQDIGSLGHDHLEAAIVTATETATATQAVATSPRC